MEALAETEAELLVVCWARRRMNLQERKPGRLLLAGKKRERVENEGKKGARFRRG